MSEESSAGSRELALLKRLPASLRHDFVETLSHEASGAALLASCENMDASGTEAENKASTQTTTKEKKTRAMARRRTKVNIPPKRTKITGGGQDVDSDSADELNSQASADERPKRSNAGKNSTIFDDKKMNAIRWEDCPMVLQVPGRRSRKPTHHDINTIPKDFQDKFHSLWQQVSTRPTYKTELDRKVKSFPRFNDAKKCIWRYCVRSSKTVDKFKMGGVPRRHSACDSCIKKPLARTHLIEHNGQITRCIVPLPEKLRVGKAWTDIVFWILETPEKG